MPQKPGDGAVAVGFRGVGGGILDRVPRFLFAWIRTSLDLLKVDLFVFMGCHDIKQTKSK